MVRLQPGCDIRLVHYSVVQHYRTGSRATQSTMEIEGWSRQMCGKMSLWKLNFHMYLNWSKRVRVEWCRPGSYCLLKALCRLRHIIGDFGKKSIYHFKIWTLPGLYAVCEVTQTADLQHKNLFTNKLWSLRYNKIISVLKDNKMLAAGKGLGQGTDFFTQ